MKTTNWEQLYSEYGNKPFNSNDLERKKQKLLIDTDVTKKQGIYEYLITGNKRCLSLRSFELIDKLAVYEEQNTNVM